MLPKTVRRARAEAQSMLNEVRMAESWIHKTKLGRTAKGVETEKSEGENGKRTPMNINHKVTSAKTGTKPKSLGGASGSKELVWGSLGKQLIARSRGEGIEQAILKTSCTWRKNSVWRPGEKRECIKNSPPVLHLSSLRITKGYIEHTASGEPWYTKDTTSRLKWPIEHTVPVPSENPPSRKVPTDTVRRRQNTTATFFVTGSRWVGGNLQTWEGRGTD